MFNICPGFLWVLCEINAKILFLVRFFFAHTVLYLLLLLLCVNEAIFMTGNGSGT